MTLYDQALVVELESGLRFNANFRYHLKPEIEKSKKTSPFINGHKAVPIQDTDDSGFDKQYVSVCDQTMIGFV